MKRNRGNTVKEFNVQVLFSGLINITVEAETEEDAIQYAEENFTREASIEDSNIDEIDITEERDID